MAVYLVQHCKILPKEEDPDRGLSREGLEETRAMAALAADNNVQVMHILHSGKKRAQQTAEIFMKALAPQAGITKGTGLAPLDDVTSFASTLNSEDDIMVVGHLPFMERLVSYLVAGSSDTSVIKFVHSGLICLGTEDASWYIRWAQYPRYV
jgi:phosphohistidine phosphatase